MIMPPQPIDVQYYFYHYLPHFMCILFHRLSVRRGFEFKRDSNGSLELTVFSLEKEIEAIL